MENANNREVPRPFFVIEEGQANLGDINKAHLMTKLAAACGADAVEFQFARADEFYVSTHPGHQIYKDREFSEEQLKSIGRLCCQLGLSLIAAPLSVTLIETLVRAECWGFNVNASDLVTPDILDEVADSGKPFFLSLLFAEEKEIEWAVNRITRKGAPEFGLLLGQHPMAHSQEKLFLTDTNLGYIATLKERYGVPVGFIDHTPFEWMPACAAVAGADVITKHMTPDRLEKGPDWQICLEPDEMGRAIDLARQARISIGMKEKVVLEKEKEDRAAMRRSICCRRAISKGAMLTADDLCFKRPGTGIPAFKLEKIIGSVVNRDLNRDHILELSDIFWKEHGPAS